MSEGQLKERRLDLALRITFESPFIVGSGFGAAGLIDMKTIRDASGIICLPATSIKGKIRAEFGKIMHSFGEPICGSAGRKLCTDDIDKACVMCRIFGSEFHEGTVIFEDAVLAPHMHKIFRKIEANRVLPQSQAAIRAGIKIDRRFRVAAEEALFVLEAANPSSVLTSRIQGTAIMNDDEYTVFCQAIESITHLGGNKSRGLGRCKIALQGAAS